MSISGDRRQFLKTSTAAVAGALGLAAPSYGFAAPQQAQVPAGEIAVRVTDANQKFAAGPPLHWRTVDAVLGSDAITLDPEKTYQQHLGIGGAFTDASCYLFHQLPTDAREDLFHEMFHPSEMGLAVGRICIGSSDYSTSMYGFDEGATDPKLERFTIEHDRAYILPVLRQARNVNPDLFLLASPWSPPGWMKPDGSMLGGCMHPKTMAVYAQYFLKFLKAYEGAGVAVDSVTSQNEVDTEQDGRMPACAWPQEYEISFVRDFLGPVLQQSGMATKIWLLDHNYNLWGRAICCLDDKGLRQHCSAVAWHGYVGTPDMMSRVHDAHPDVEMYWTEGGPDLNSKDYATEWSNWGTTFTGILRNWCRTIIGWNLALDEDGNPNIGPFKCGGTITINSQTKAITRSGQFWAMNHFSRSLGRGARRFDSQGGPEDVFHVAYGDSHGRQLMIVTNPGAAKTVQMKLGTMMADTSLPSDSLVTLMWNAEPSG
jgi:glucosylceramidase